MKLQKGILLTEQEQKLLLSVFYTWVKNWPNKCQRKGRGSGACGGTSRLGGLGFSFFSFSLADEEIWDCSRFLPWTQNPPRVFMEVDPSFFMEKVEANSLSPFSSWDLVSVRQTKGREDKGEIRYLGSLSYDAAISQARLQRKSMGGELDVDPAHRRGTFMTRMLYMVMDLTL